MAIKLKNSGQGMKTVALDHDVLCGTGRCHCSAEAGVKLNRDKATGLRTSYAIQKKRHAQTVTLLHGETSGLLPERVLRCRDVVNGRAQKWLTVEDLPGVPAPIDVPLPAGKKDGDVEAPKPEVPATEVVAAEAAAAEVPATETSAHSEV